MATDHHSDEYTVVQTSKVHLSTQTPSPGNEAACDCSTGRCGHRRHSTTTQAMTSFVDKPFPISEHRDAIRSTFDRLILISSTGFALTAGSSTSLAVATSLFGSEGRVSEAKLRDAARMLGISTAIFGIGFTSSVVATLIPLSQLERAEALRIVKILIVAPSFVVFLGPLWAVQWATLIYGQGMISIFGLKPFGSIFLVGTLACIAVLAFVFSLS